MSESIPSLIVPFPYKRHSLQTEGEAVYPCLHYYIMPGGEASTVLTRKRIEIGRSFR